MEPPHHWGKDQEMGLISAPRGSNSWTSFPGARRLSALPMIYEAQAGLRDAGDLPEN